MNDFRKNKLIEYLYPTIEAKEFMAYDFYAELINVLEKKVCFSNDNKKVSVRNANFVKAKSTIYKFINENLNYKNRLKELYLCEIDDNFIEELLWGYILFVTSNINHGTGADVFRDCRSVCYKRVSILDV